MKYVNAPISVEARKGIPRRLRWGRRVYDVRRLLDFWILQSRWWGREEKRVYFRLDTDGGVVEVYREERGGKSEEGVRREERRAKSEEGKEKSGKRGGSEACGGGPAPAGYASGPPAAHPPFVEGDTHTRELRQTESSYRPDAADLAARRARRKPAASTSGGASPPRWVLSKVAD